MATQTMAPSEISPVSPEIPNSLHVAKNRSRGSSGSPSAAPSRRSPRSPIQRRHASAGSVTEKLALQRANASPEPTPSKPARKPDGSTPPRVRRVTEPPPAPATPSPPKLVRETKSSPAVITTSAKKSPSPRGQRGKAPTVGSLVAELLHKPLDLGELENTKKGYNYVFNTIFNDQPDKAYVKVGRTDNSPKGRQSSIRSSCRIELREDQKFIKRPIRHRKRAENLIKAELRLWRHDFNCRCGHQHQEYFDVSTAFAIEVTNRWTHFCNTEPWDTKGKLHPFWIQRLEDLQSQGLDNLDNHRSRSLAWKTFASPEFYEVYAYNANELWRSFLKRREEWWLYISAFLIACFPYSGYLGFQFFVLATFGIVVKVTFEETPLMYNSARKDQSNKGCDVEETPDLTEDISSEEESFMGVLNEESDDEGDRTLVAEEEDDSMELDDISESVSTPSKPGSETEPIVISDDETENSIAKDFPDLRIKKEAGAG